MAGNMGVDGRDLLPPFMPVLAGEDVLFGTCRHAMLPYSCSALLPYTLVHAPPDSRSTGTPVPLQLLTNILLSTLLVDIGSYWPRGAVSDAMRGIGAFVRSLGTWRAEEFRSYVEGVVRARLLREADILEQELLQRTDATGEWRLAGSQVIEERRRLALSTELASPPDLPGDPIERQTLFQDLLCRYGTLLAHWPEIIQAAFELRSEGHRVSHSV